MEKVTITHKGALRLKSGHPWIFRSDISGTSEGLRPGDVVEVLSPKGQFLGQAFYSPRSQITLRMIAKTRRPVDRDYWKNLLEASVKRRREIQTERECVRLVFSEADFIPSVIVDVYGDRSKPVVVFQTLSAGADRLREEFISLLEEILNPTAIVERNDPSVRDLEGLVRQKGVVRGSLPGEIWVRQGSVTMHVDPIDGQKTGLYLDQAENHITAARYARGRALDLFSYQGGFALSVAKACDEVTAVDSSAPALAMLSQNAARNGIVNVSCVEKNAFDYLHECQDAGNVFDTVILDPPPFVRDRKNMMGALRGYKEINLRALKILRPGGVLITCSCSQNFTPALFEETLKEASRDAHREIQILEKRGAAPDHPVLLSFPESNYLQCWIVRVV